MQTQIHTTTRGAAYAGFGRCLNVLILLAVGAAQASNIHVTNVQWQTAGSEVESFVQFDLTWDNSWRSAWSEEAADNVTLADLSVTNWDAAWVFVKFRQPGTPGYSHATLATNVADHAMPAGATNTVGLTDGKGVGVFIYRNAVGKGANAFTSVKLRWLHASNGVVNPNIADLQVHAIEMVYVDKGAFNAGCGMTNLSAFTSTVINTNNPTVAGGYPTGETAPTYATWPNGYNAFYCMKYELTEGQWVNFFNTLTDEQKIGRDLTGSNAGVTYGGKGSDEVVYRNTVAWTNAAVDATTMRPDRACNWLCWRDGVSYAAWAGLRPMTELEFEKACRGPRNPVSNEYAWGTATLGAKAKTLSGAETGTETVTTDVSLGAAHHGTGTITSGDGGTGPLRVGIFATPGSTRVSSGASYWGIMELSGNVSERAVTIGNSEGRAFQGTHGAGTVILPVDWPQANANGAGHRGESWVNAGMQVSSRGAAIDLLNSTTSYCRNKSDGWRGVRSAPSGVEP